ncbi:hypothetical protein GW17_00015783 [Ensete ventricosum]|nr:hypothetical protein GW17_00015783 [Ensete ventricosum]
MGHRTKEGGGALRVGRHEGTGVERALFLRWAEAGWCLCKPELGDTALQKTLDYACGAGADCTPILQTGACYIPNTVKDHCSNSTPATSTTPGTYTPTTGGLSGLGPTTSISTDNGNGGFLPKAGMGSLLLLLLIAICSGIALLG